MYIVLTTKNIDKDLQNMEFGVPGMLSIQANWVKNFSEKALTTFSLASAGCEVKKDMKVQIAGGAQREREREAGQWAHT